MKDIINGLFLICLLITVNSITKSTTSINELTSNSAISNDQGFLKEETDNLIGN